MKDKREFRGSAWRWALVFVVSTVLIVASFLSDRTVRGWMVGHQDPGTRTFMEALSRFGDWPEHVGLGLILLAAAWWRGSKPWMRIFAAMIVACALAGVSTRVVKIAAGRPRPNVQTDAGWSGPNLSARYQAFPSGHTAASTAFFAALAFASRRAGAGLLVVPVLIAFSRMYVGAHHLSDVVAAAVIGVVCGWIVMNRLRSLPSP
ncbi:MAG TPA: phosphatase PAP2 family protein [Chthoniobacterales bacterium]|nr:phosphatase PAP2 family protein [Chthoniobacterales bacterium]